MSSLLSLYERPSHHEVSSHTGLEDAIKGALGVRAVGEGEHFRYVAKAVLVISCAHDRYRHLRVKLGRSIILSTWRIKDILSQLDGYVEPWWIAGMVQLGLQTLNLEEVKSSEAYHTPVYYV